MFTSGTRSFRWVRALLGSAALVGVTLIAGCGGGGGGGGGDPGGDSRPVLQGNFSPIAVGNRWIYTSSQGSWLTVDASAATSVEGRAGVRVVETEANQPAASAIYVPSAEGLRRYPDGSDDLEAAIGPVWLLRYPLRAGDRFAQVRSTLSSFDVDGDGRADTVTINSDVEVIGLETVSTPLGTMAGSLHVRTMATIDVRSSITGQTTQVRSTVDDWYAPDIGPVRSVSAILEAGSTEVETYTLSAWRVGDRRSESTPPVLQTTLPAQGVVRGATGVIVASFDEALDIASAQRAFTLLNPAGDRVPGIASIDPADDRLLRFAPQSPLASGRHTARFDPGLQDILGNATTAAISWTFDVDTSGPILVSSTPAEGALDVGLSSTLVLRFDEVLDPATLNNSTIGLAGVLLEISVSGSEVSITPTQPLERLRDYTLVIGSGVTDVHGNALPEVIGINFRTEPGRFAQPRSLPNTGGSALAIGDLDGDGLADVVNTWLDTSSSPASPYLVLHRQLADGSLAAPVLFALGGNPACGTGMTSLVLGDLNGDGRTDAVVGHGPCGIEIVHQAANASLVRGPFIATTRSDKLRLADVDGDGRLDIVGAGAQNTAIQIWRQGVGGVFEVHATPAVATFFPDIEVGDLNGDGRPDIVVLQTPQGAALLLQQADGQFAAPQILDSDGRNARGVAIGDVNGDGRQDLVLTFSSNAPANLGVFHQRSDGSLAPMQLLASLDMPWQVRVIDVNGDGRDDIVVGHSGFGRVGVYLQSAGGTLGAEALYPAGSLSNSNPQAMAVGDVTGDGRPDIVVDGQLLTQIPVGLFSQRVPRPTGAIAAGLQRLNTGAR